MPAALRHRSKYSRILLSLSGDRENPKFPRDLHYHTKELFYFAGAKLQLLQLANLCASNRNFDFSQPNLALSLPLALCTANNLNDLAQILFRPHLPTYPRD